MEEEKIGKIRENLSVEMVLVEGGDTYIHDEGVTLGSFYMANTPVTQELYESVTGKNPSNFRGKNLPVECVSWYDAVEFCNALSNRDGLTPCYSESGKDTKCDFSADGYRLPTEAEWEYAANGGRSENGFMFAGSDDIGEVAWYGDNSEDRTHPVAEKMPNSLGLYDMSGNVYEWCWDWWEDEFTGGANPSGAAAGDCRVLRGGSWIHPFGCSTVLFRTRHEPDIKGDILGFRLVRSA